MNNKAVPSQTVWSPRNRFLRRQNTKQQSLAIMTFILNNQEYGIEFLKVQETRRFDFVNQISDTPSFFKGIINYQGEALPVIDLRSRHSLAQLKSSTYTEVIILNLASGLIGIAVDSIIEVTLTKFAKLLAVPTRISDIESSFLHGLAQTEDRMVILVDIEKLALDREKAMTKVLCNLVKDKQFA